MKQIWNNWSCRDTFGKKHGWRGTCHIMQTCRVPEVLNPESRASLPWNLVSLTLDVTLLLLPPVSPPLEIPERTTSGACRIINGTLRRSVNWLGFYYTRAALRLRLAKEPPQASREKLRIYSPRPMRIFSAALRSIFGSQSPVPVAIKRG